ncbi:hypothetical protein P43SY_008119 [Pythium insidiosum]|uniref:Kinesin motor domain-containing protein n=1 Tax=Pythium insidiosum TaxID=114742 RepID=A0AAD5LG30_PYTIN|nr:hypothetical protein P43SY_008119 [Pythium insidiosum]
MEDDNASVRVAVRVRPLIGREKVERCDECVSVVEAERQVVMGKNRAFTYDYVFSKYAQQSDVWHCVEPLAAATFDGYNATVFAYGQTGSGKTFTMGSGSAVHLAPEDWGIIPRVIAHLFERVESREQATPQYSAELRVRFLEVYGEEIRDLLGQLSGPESGDSKVTLREGESGEVQVVGALEEPVDDAEQCMRLLERGTLARTTGSTLMNAHSSRSHAILTVSMLQRIPIEGATPDSSDSLGGNSRTLMLCCVSPADVNFEETLNALKYANRARNIKNKPVVNRDEGSAMAAELRRQFTGDAILCPVSAAQ